MNRPNLVIGAGIILCATSVLWLEARFSAADRRKAEHFVRSYRVDHRSESFGELVASSADGAVGSWDATVLDDCRGLVRVRWRVSGQPQASAVWDVSLSTGELFAAQGSSEAKRLLDTFHAPAAESRPSTQPPTKEAIGDE